MRERGLITYLTWSAPIRTVSELNCREHPVIRRKRKRAQKHETKIEMLHAMGIRRTFKLPLVIHLHRIGPQLLDEGDNLSAAFKAIRDEIAGIIGVDDHPGSLIRFEYSQERAGARRYSVKVTIQTVET